MPNIITNLNDIIEEFVNSKVSIHHLKLTNTTDPQGDYNVPGETDTYTFWGDANETVNLGHFSVTHGTKPSVAMIRSEYDSDGSGVVDDSEALGGKSLVQLEADIATAVSDSAIAMTMEINNAIANLIDGAPGALDTLNELAAALGDDSDFISTITNSLALKLNSASYTSEDVKYKYESNSDTNVFTDAEKTKLSNITTTITEW